MQNYFLSRALERNAKSGRHLSDRLPQDAIPSARKAQMRVIWLNWGLDEQDLATIPPVVTRTFGSAGPDYAARRSDHAQTVNATLLDKFGKPKSKSSHKYAGLGSEYQGIVCDPDTGDKIHDPGLCLMKGAWHSALHSPLDDAYLEGSRLEIRPDVLLHKNRMSGLCGATSEFERFLHAEGITTLFFSGVDTDHCVGGTLQDGYKSYDCILLSDACSTTSPPGAQESVEWNVANTWDSLHRVKSL